MKLELVLVTLAVAFFFSTPAQAKFVDVSATTNGATILVTPAGNGESLIGLAATVQLVVTSMFDGTPVPGYPLQDLWLWDHDVTTLGTCGGMPPNVADANTDAEGRTQISGIMIGGGHSQTGLTAYGAGSPSSDVIPIFIVSPDINGSLSVDLADLGIFADDFNDPTYQFRSDLSHDGTEDLGDVAIMAEHMGERCP